MFFPFISLAVATPCGVVCWPKCSASALHVILWEPIIWVSGLLQYTPCRSFLMLRDGDPFHPFQAPKHVHVAMLSGCSPSTSGALFLYIAHPPWKDSAVMSQTKNSYSFLLVLCMHLPVKMHRENI